MRCSLHVFQRLCLARFNQGGVIMLTQGCNNFLLSLLKRARQQLVGLQCVVCHPVFCEKAG